MARRIIVYGNPDKARDGFATAEKFVQYIQEGIFTKADGRYRFTQNKEAHVIVMSRDAKLYGHFEISDRVKPDPRDKEKWPNVKSVYLVKASALYGTPVPLAAITDTKIRFGKSITEDQFARVLAKANAVSYFDGISVVRDHELRHDLECIAQRADIAATSKRVLVDARLGQGKFRDDVLQLWGKRCAVTGATTNAAIRASHIKPWCKSDDAERLDPCNGLPLVARLDALFDAKLISFHDDGQMLVSEKLSSTEKKLFGLPKPLSRKPSAATAAYLAHHRGKRFLGGID